MEGWSIVAFGQLEILALEMERQRCERTVIAVGLDDRWGKISVSYIIE